jgi:hypothetical protein
MAKIHGPARAGATLALALVAGGCGPPKGITPSAAATAAAPPTLPPRPLAQVYVLEASGSQPEDTTVTAPSRSRLVVVLRRSAPDFGLFVQLEFADSSLVSPAAGGLATVTIRPRPSLYGLDLAVEGTTVGPGATIAFSYGAHFVAPAGARERYGSNLAFEKAQAIGRLEGDSTVVFLPTSRPGSDILTAPLPGPGRYLVAAPR